jgi:ABC-type Mn2+/Zn2+ transport system ATPase subunit
MKLSYRYRTCEVPLCLLRRLKGRMRWVRAAGGVLTDEGGDMLLIRRNGRWDLPKGKVEPGESLRQGAMREVLEQVGMETKAYKKPYELSGGEQQRVVIARALLNSPEIILADEPTGNLDAGTGREIMDLLYSISQAGITVLMSTHNLLWPEQFPGKRWLFENGVIEEKE